MTQQNNKEIIEKEEKIEWMEIGFQGIIFKIPKEYNHQLVKDAEILMKHFYNKGLQKALKMIEKWAKQLRTGTYENIEEDYFELSYEDIKRLKSSIIGSEEK